MKFNEKLLAIRKKQGLSQEELGMELQVSRQTISKWEAGQSYPDFQRLVMLSDYFGMSLDELVKDIDVQDVREKNLTDEKVASIFSDVQNVKNFLGKWCKIVCYVALAFMVMFCIGYVVHLFFPDIEWLFRTKS
ncbi:MAG: helix-turn-helix transcriptional regulator [Lachnospiraceae bacterium]|nr:helix-turn-helix transcriptional regulator [Lachnospiraceae bacterium]